MDRVIDYVASLLVRTCIPKSLFCIPKGSSS